jgi:LmbE family N-acetylglucosaminyl deacetylase
MTRSKFDFSFKKLHNILMKDKVILVVAAHPDDPEFGCGATVAKYVKEGALAYYAICTNGCRGSRDHHFEQSKLIEDRVKEQKKAAEIIGVTETFFLDHEDGDLVCNISLKEELVKIIRKLKPTMIFTHDPSWFYMQKAEGAYINHNDHRQTGIATLDAVYPLSRDLASFPGHLDEGLTPHKVAEVYLFSSENPNFLVDVEETWELKIRAILAHKSQIDEPAKTRKQLEEKAISLGEKSGHKFAEGFMKLVLH